jgi:hypothetical protein
MVLTEATGDAELVLWDGREFGHFYERIDQIQKRLDRFTSSQATKVIVHEKRKAWRSFGSDWPIFHIRAKLVSAATKDTIKYCMVILLVLGNGVAIGGGYNNSNYEDKVVVRAPVDSAWAPKSVVAEANVASVINRLDSQPAVTRPDITPTTILPGILEDVRPARPAVTNKIVYITPDGGARTLYCNPGPSLPWIPTCKTGQPNSFGYESRGPISLTESLVQAR